MPDELATSRARNRALAALRRRRLRRPAAAVLAAALVALGVGIGALATPSGTAAPAPTGLGFLACARLERPPGTAATVWLSSRRRRGRERRRARTTIPTACRCLRFETLLPHGVLIVAAYRGAARSTTTGPSRRASLAYGRRGHFGIEAGVQIRPEQPLGEYEGCEPP